MLRVYSFLLSVSFFTSCVTNRDDSQMVLNKYREMFKLNVIIEGNELKECSNAWYNGTLTAKFKYNKNHRLTSVQTFYDDSLFGNSFEFYDDGGIKNYMFYSTPVNYSFTRSFDLNGFVTEEDGNPYAYHLDLYDDSIELYFAKVFDYDLAVYYSEIKQHKLDSINDKLDLVESATQPFIYHAYLPYKRKYYLNIGYMKKVEGVNWDLKVRDSIVY